MFNQTSVYLTVTVDCNASTDAELIVDWTLRRTGEFSLDTKWRRRFERKTKLMIDASQGVSTRRRKEYIKA